MKDTINKQNNILMRLFIFNDNKEYFNSIDKETFIEKNTTPGEQFNFYMQMIMDFNRRPRPTITEPIFKEDKPGTIYIPSTF